MGEYDRMPISEVENIPLSLKDRNEKGGVEVVSVQKTSQICSPVTQLF
jgi:hypothetical protein